MELNNISACRWRRILAQTFPMAAHAYPESNGSQRRKVKAGLLYFRDFFQAIRLAWIDASVDKQAPGPPGSQWPVAMAQGGRRQVYARAIAPSLLPACVPDEPWRSCSTGRRRVKVAIVFRSYRCLVCRCEWIVGQRTFTRVISSPFGSVRWTAQAIQGSKLCIVRRISTGCSASCSVWLSSSAAS